MPEHPIAAPPPDPAASPRREWSTPRLERLDVDDTEMGTPVAKNPSTFEGATSYKSPAVCA